MNAATLPSGTEGRPAANVSTLAQAAAANASSAVAMEHDTAQIEISNLRVTYGDAIAVHDISFQVHRGEHLTLLGPSGCGKTTTLRAIAGLEKPTGGSIVIDGRTVFSSDRKTNLPAEKRGVSMVFQSYAIWPHMTVFENVAYGLRVRRRGADELNEAVKHALRLVQMQKYAGRSSSNLSGGQQQRVAIARAIAFSPSVVLFDEPLSNLDAKLRGQMRVELRDLQRELNITSVYVTHDQEEALAISDRIIIMNGGRIEQIGSPHEIYDRPRTRFVADFVGSANLISGKLKGPVGSARTITFETTGGVMLRGVAPFGLVGNETEVSVRTAYIRLTATPPSDVNQISGRVTHRIFHGDFIQYILLSPGGPLEIRRPPTELFDVGAELYASFAPEHCILLESATGT